MRRDAETRLPVAQGATFLLSPHGLIRPARAGAPAN